MAKKKRDPRCPVCRKPVPRDPAAPLPFCSERCRLIDLGNWLGAAYAVPGRPADAHDDDRDGDE